MFPSCCLFLSLCRQRPHSQGHLAHPRHHAGGAAARRESGQEEQLQERRGEPAGDPGEFSLKHSLCSEISPNGLWVLALSGECCAPTGCQGDRSSFSSRPAGLVSLLDKSTASLWIPISWLLHVVRIMSSDPWWWLCAYHRGSLLAGMYTWGLEHNV